jgi:ribosomal protein L37E
MLKRTTKEVAEYFKQQGCELMDEYFGCQEPMDYRCKCGRYATATWNNFSRGRRCGYCHITGRKQKYHIDEMKEIFKERGCILLEAEYKDGKTPMQYICKCGRESKITFAGFHHQNQYCVECGKEKNKKERHHAWRKDRDQLKQDKLFRKKIYKALQSTLQATNKTKIGHTSDMLGYGPKELQEHITSHPNWLKVKDTNWHLDHIFPVNAFLERSIRDVKLINCLENLQPVTQLENNQKWAHYNKPAFEEWLKNKNTG